MRSRDRPRGAARQARASGQARQARQARQERQHRAGGERGERAKRHARPRTVAIAVALAVGAGVAGAPATARAQQVHELRHDVATDLVVTATAVTLTLGAELAKPDLVPKTCRWCDRASDGRDTLNGLDAAARRALRWNDTRTAAQASNATGFLAAPSIAFVTLAASGARDHAESKVPVDVLVTVEAVAVGGVLNEIVKLAAARERPFVHALPDEEKPRAGHPSDDDLSFYSGHTSLAFGLAAASGTVASLRGYRLAPLVWASGLAIAALTGYLRVAADKHYLTDVLGGVLAGGAAGVLVPLLFHGRRPAAEARAPLFAPRPPDALSAFPVTLSGAF
jgi:membrane-associated phospholipid phosphatase